MNIFKLYSRKEHIVIQLLLPIRKGDKYFNNMKCE